MEKLGIAGFGGRSYSGLSGGEQRRVLLARAFCAAGNLLVLDEPAAGLDAQASAGLYRLLREFRAETGAAVVVVSHDVAAAVVNATKILHLERRTVYFGAASDYLASGLGDGFSGCVHG